MNKINCIMHFVIRKIKIKYVLLRPSRWVGQVRQVRYIYYKFQFERMPLH